MEKRRKEKSTDLVTKAKPGVDRTGAFFECISDRVDGSVFTAGAGEPWTDQFESCVVKCLVLSDLDSFLALQKEKTN